MNFNKRPTKPLQYPSSQWGDIKLQLWCDGVETLARWPRRAEFYKWVANTGHAKLSDGFWQFSEEYIEALLADPSEIKAYMNIIL